MNEYEHISNTCKIKFIDNFKVNYEKYTQVSGYIFDDNNQLLIVKNDKTWTIPGGHPEVNESAIDTLNREIMEEACITIKDIKYIGAVEVVENNETYYQLRYTAKVDQILPFEIKWEINERKFVNLKDLSSHITWSKGIAFSKQIDSAKKIWDI